MRTAIARRHAELRRLREARTREGKRGQFLTEMNDLFTDQSVSLTDFSVRGLAEAMIDDGHEFVETFCRPASEGGFHITEAADNVNTGLFANVFGQYMYSAVLRAYQMPELIGDMLVTTRDTIFNGEKIPGVNPIGDNVEVIGEGSPYPQAVFGERWIETPETIKRGLIVDVTKEAVFFDRTALILDQASKVGQYIAINREKRILDVVCGLVTIYRRNGAAAVATYGADNTKTGNALSDWTNIDALDQLFNQMTDPDSGEPIVISPKVLLVPKALEIMAKRVQNATMTIHSGSNRETRVEGYNSLKNAFAVISSQYVKARTSSDTSYFYGDPKNAFVYMQNWPLKVEQETATGPLGFSRDIVARYKASERGAAGVQDRLQMTKSTP